ncbi:hypothetical protein MtrunA17_Chr2g0292201 [Medicago truncatula]|uniref:Transmembrane protein n=1 Tax=Medicago truncatula TaxID=3880 RepID=A0A396J8U2_MEDTR|nr:hypothetical protein MtrunA17_Chr2g0292201 [Medicago truncatula]
MQRRKYKFNEYPIVFMWLPGFGEPALFSLYSAFGAMWGILLVWYVIYLVNIGVTIYYNHKLAFTRSHEWHMPI